VIDRHALATAHVGYSIAQGRRLAGRRLPRDEARSASLMALAVAASRCDEARAGAFPAYLCVHIRKEVNDAIRARALIRVPEDFFKAKSAWLDGGPRQRATRHADALRARARLALGVGSLSEAGPGGRVPLWATVADPGGADPDAIDPDDLAGLPARLGRLTAREREVIESRYGLGGRAAATLREVAESRATSYQNIQQIEGRALAKLRRMYGTDAGEGHARRTAG
jgi:RNA polymerase sigma factor (sigma-70 family)